MSMLPYCRGGKAGKNLLNFYLALPVSFKCQVTNFVGNLTKAVHFSMILHWVLQGDNSLLKMMTLWISSNMKKICKCNEQKESKKLEQMKLSIYF